MKRLAVVLLVTCLCTTGMRLLQAQGQPAQRQQARQAQTQQQQGQKQQQGTQAKAQPDILNVIPSNSLGFVIVHNLQETSEALDEIADTLNLPTDPASMLESIRRQLGLEEGILRTSGSAAFVWLPTAEQGFNPFPVAIVPVENYQAFAQEVGAQGDEAVQRGELGERPVVIGRRGAYALVTPEENEAALRQVLEADAQLAQSVQQLQPWINQQNIAAVLTPQGAERLLEAAQQGLQAAEGFFAQAQEDEQPPVPAEQVELIKQSLGVYRGWVEASRGEIQALAVGLRRAEEEAVYFSARAQFTPGGDFAQAIQQVEQLEGKPLAKLPNVPFAVAFGGPLPEAWADALSELSLQGMKAGWGMPGMQKLPQEEMQQIAKASAQALEGLRGVAFVLGSGKGQGGIYDETYSLMKVENAEQYVQNYRQTIERLSQLSKNKDIPYLPEYTIEQVQIDNRDAWKIVANLNLEDLPQDQPGADFMQNLLKAVVGPEGKLVAYMIAVDNNTILIAYTAEEQLKRLIQSYQAEDQGLLSSQGVAKTARLLPEDRQWQGFLSLGGVQQLVRNVLQQAAPERQPLLPDLPESPPVGWSVSASEAGLTEYVVVPEETLEAIGEVVEAVRERTEE